jgi:hypothetical protein
VACVIVQYEGKVFVPADPEKSSTPIAVSWAIASKLVTRLSFLLALGLRIRRNPSSNSTRASRGFRPRLEPEPRVADQMAWIGHEDLDDERIEGHHYPLIRASEIWRGATLLRDAAEAPGFDSEDSTTALTKTSSST